MTLRSAATASLVLVLLAGCSAPSTPAVVTTPGPTVTVTATPAPAPTPTPIVQALGDPLSPLDAWTTCAGVASTATRDMAPDAKIVPLTGEDLAARVSWNAAAGYYDAQVSMEPSGDFDFLAVLCHVGGTLGNPTIDSTVKTH